jgi:hypothetical protein
MRTKGTTLSLTTSTSPRSFSSDDEAEETKEVEEEEKEECSEASYADAEEVCLHSDGLQERKC